MQLQAIIRLKNATFYAYHGVMSDEQNLGGKFEVDVDLYTEVGKAAVSDNLEETVDYEKVYGSIQKTVTERKYFLLETLGHAIASRLLAEFTRIARVAVRVRKPHPPVKGVVDSVEVELTEGR